MITSKHIIESIEDDFDTESTIKVYGPSPYHEFAWNEDGQSFMMDFQLIDTPDHLMVVYIIGLRNTNVFPTFSDSEYLTRSMDDFAQALKNTPHINSAYFYKDLVSTKDSHVVINKYVPELKSEGIVAVIKSTHWKRVI